MSRRYHSLSDVTKSTNCRERKEPDPSVAGERVDMDRGTEYWRMRSAEHVTECGDVMPRSFPSTPDIARRMCILEYDVVCEDRYSSKQVRSSGNPYTLRSAYAAQQALPTYGLRQMVPVPNGELVSFQYNSIYGRRRYPPY